MSTAQATSDLTEDTPEAVGGLRVLVVCPQGIDATGMLAARIDRFVHLYLQKNWLKPRRFQSIKPLCYALFAGPGVALQPGEVEAVRARIEDHLFGDGEHGLVKVLGLVANLDEVTNWINAPEAKAEGQSAEQRRALKFGAWESDAADDLNSSCLDHATPIEGFGFDDGGAPKRAPARSGAHTASDLVSQFAFQGVVSLHASALFSTEVVFRATGVTPTRPIATRHHTGDNEPDPAEIDALLFADLCFAQCSPDDGARFVVIPVRYDTLAIPARRGPYLRALDELNPALCGGLVLSVFDTPERPDPYAARRVLDHVHPYARFVDWRVGHGYVDTDRMRQIAMHSITFDPGLAAGAPDVERARFLAKVGELRRAGVRTGLTGVAKGEEVAAAQEAGVTYLSGPAISGQLSMPMTARRMELDTLPLAEPKARDSAAQ